MLKNIHIFFISLAIFLLLIYFSFGALISFLLTFGIISIFIAYNVFNLRRSLFVKTISRINTNEKIVFLTFDDGPEKNATSQILTILKEKKVPACFFCIGSKVLRNWELAQRIHREGHIMGIHSMNHQIKDTFISRKKYIYELQQCIEIIHQITGYRPLLFRPPFGVSNPGISGAMKNFGLTCLGWTVRSFDTRTNDREVLLTRIESKLKPGAIVLLHDLDLTAEALPEIIQIIHEKGYNILSLQQFIDIGKYE